MSFDKVQILKFERTNKGGSQNNFLQTIFNPSEDGYIGKGIDLVHNESDPYSDTLSRGVDLDSSGNLRFRDTNVTTLLKDIATIDFFTDRNEPNGFVDIDQFTDSFTDSTRAFSIQPVGTSFEYYATGVHYDSTGDTLVISDVEGVHIIYYDNAGIKEVVNPDDLVISQIIREECLITFVYWDATNKTGNYFSGSRHGIQMSGATHAYNHFVFGMQYCNGLGLNSILADANGSLDSHAQFGVDSGGGRNEDSTVESSAIASNVGLPVFYREGVDGNWRKDTNAGFSVLTTGTGRIAYNEYTGTTWQVSEVGNGDYVLYHVFLTDNKNNPIISVMGQFDYTNTSDVYEGVSEEVHNLLLGMAHTGEMTPIGTLIFETRDNLSNSIKSRIISNKEGEDYSDFRISAVQRVAGAGYHGTLGGLSNDDHKHYLKIDGRGGQTINDDITIADTKKLYFKDANSGIDLDTSDNLRFFDKNGSKLLKNLISGSYDSEDTTNEDFTGSSYSVRTTTTVSALDAGDYRIKYYFDFGLNSSDVDLIYKLEVNTNNIVENTIALVDRSVSYMPIHSVRNFTLATGGDLTVSLSFKTSETWGVATINYSNIIIERI